VQRKKRKKRKNDDKWIKYKMIKNSKYKEENKYKKNLFFKKQKFTILLGKIYKLFLRKNTIFF